MKINFEKKHPDAKMPTYATDGSGCFDLYAISAETSPTSETAIYDTGLSVAVPKGFTLFVLSRSGHGFKSDLRLANCVGAIDSDYRGKIMVKLRSDGTHSPLLDLSKAIAQAAIIATPQVEFLEVDALDDTERGCGGFGHTDKKE